MEEKGSTCNTCPCFNKDELKHRLSPLQYQVTQEKGTERAYTGKFYKLKEEGIYSCIVCNQELFSSDTKYDSGCGWPAFSDIIDKSRVNFKTDLSHVGGNLLLLAIKPDMARTEVSCSQCKAHLGHVFNDGPKPTGKRYCVNSASLNFKAISEQEQAGEILNDKEEKNDKSKDDKMATTTQQKNNTTK